MENCRETRRAEHRSSRGSQDKIDLRTFLGKLAQRLLDIEALGNMILTHDEHSDTSEHVV